MKLTLAMNISTEFPNINHKKDRQVHITVRDIKGKSRGVLFPLKGVRLGNLKVRTNVQVVNV